MTSKENESQNDGMMNYRMALEPDSYQSTNLMSKRGLIQRLRKGRNARARFVESHLDKKLALQIRSLRGDLSQEDMEQKVGIKQQALSRLENPLYGKATITTLKKIAAGCDVGLLVEFVPYSQLVNRVSGTPYTERGYGPETMNVPSFEDEEKSGVFESPANPQDAAMGSNAQQQTNELLDGIEQPVDSGLLASGSKPPKPDFGTLTLEKRA